MRSGLIGPLVLAVTLIGTLAGCAAFDGAAGGSAPSEYVGALRNDAAAIGGETTGWVLKRKGSADLEVDVSRVRTEAESLAGLLVRVRGKVEERSYVERGRVPVLVVERVVLAK